MNVLTDLIDRTRHTEFTGAVYLSMMTLVMVTACGQPDNASNSDAGALVTDDIIKSVASVDGERIRQADQEPGNWLAHGRTYDEARFSLLDQINADNVAEMGLAWYFDTGTNRGLEASPIVVDGVMYTTGAWSIVFAHNAVTGELLWTYDPEVPKAWGANACCDVVNRGVAVWKGRVYVGSLDGRLIAIDAATGERDWEVNTIDRSKPYTITGAPRVVNDLVIIGNGGAEYGVRGYVTAYDTLSGAERWRFYTVPGDPSLPFEDSAMAVAAETWTG
ncbi:MAG: PQQ-binding-like beta-propeller repeat protein, partial [Pseudomonadota bacterium]